MQRALVPVRAGAAGIGDSIVVFGAIDAFARPIHRLVQLASFVACISPIAAETPFHADDLPSIFSDAFQLTMGDLTPPPTIARAGTLLRKPTVDALAKPPVLAQRAVIGPMSTTCHVAPITARPAGAVLQRVAAVSTFRRHALPQAVSTPWSVAMRVAAVSALKSGITRIGPVTGVPIPFAAAVRMGIAGSVLSARSTIICPVDALSYSPVLTIGFRISFCTLEAIFTVGVRRLANRRSGDPQRTRGHQYQHDSWTHHHLFSVTVIQGRVKPHQYSLPRKLNRR